MEPIDWQLCKKLAGNKEDLAQEMLEMLIKSLPSDIEIIKQTFEKNELYDLREYVHKLHGACCYVGVPKLKAIAKELENALASDSIDKVKYYLIALEKEARDILKHYEQETLLLTA